MDGSTPQLSHACLTHRLLVRFIETGYVGQKRLGSAIEAFRGSNPESKVEVEWKPYMIDPSITVHGESLEAYCLRRWGSANMKSRFQQEGPKSGAHFADWQFACNTLKAHRFIQFANEKYAVDTDQSNAAIFNALYEEGKNISLVDTLVDVGVNQLNLPDANEVRQYLQSDEGEYEVKAEIDSGRRKYRISGVPFFVIEAEGGSGQPYGMSGAQNKETFLDIFQELDEA